MRLYEILDSEKPDKIEKVGVKITSYYSFKTVERLIILALEQLRK